MRPQPRRLVRTGIVVLLGSTLFVAPGSVSATPALSGAETYLVVYKQPAVPSNAASTIATAGGRLVYSYDDIGVAVASTSTSTFRSTLMGDSRVDGVSSTARFGTRVDPANLGATGTAAAAPDPAPGRDSLTGLQWDMDQIHATEARAITGGSSSVVVGDIDTGWTTPPGPGAERRLHE